LAGVEPLSSVDDLWGRSCESFSTLLRESEYEAMMEVNDYEKTIF